MEFTTLITIALLVACIILLSINYKLVKRQRLNALKESLVSHETGSLLADKILLEQINNKQYEQAAALLQSAIDTRVVIIWNSLGSINSPKSKTALTALRIIRDFQKSSPVANNLVSTNLEDQKCHNEATAILNKLDSTR